MYNQDQLNKINEFKSNGIAFASMAWRNNGEVKPITIMLEGYTTDEIVGASTINLGADADAFHMRMMSKFTGVNFLKRNTLLVNFTEDQFDQTFLPFGVSSDMVDFGTRNADGKFVATPLVVSSADIFETAIGLHSIDTTNEDVVFDENNELRNGWQAKSVNGIELTKDGDQIYRRVMIAPVGTKNQRIAQDQSFSQRDLTTVLENAKNAEATRQEAPAIV
jgi:hypothetical protein